jgi:hypothetical protein
MLTPVVLAALAAAAPAVVDHSVDATAPTITVAVDTVPKIKPRLFERRVLFSPEYLNRLLYTVWRASAPEPVVEISPPDETGRAAAYARMYGIDHSLALKIVQHALAEGLDPDLAFRLVRVESVFKPNARGPSGSLGLTQLMPSTARALDRSLRTEAAILARGSDTSVRSSSATTEMSGSACSPTTAAPETSTGRSRRGGTRRTVTRCWYSNGWVTASTTGPVSWTSPRNHGAARRSIDTPPWSVIGVVTAVHQARSPERSHLDHVRHSRPSRSAFIKRRSVRLTSPDGPTAIRAAARSNPPPGGRVGPRELLPVLPFGCLQRTPAAPRPRRYRSRGKPVGRPGRRWRVEVSIVQGHRG